MNIFCDYDIVRELLKPKQFSIKNILAPLVLTTLQNLILIVMVYSGNKATAEVKKTAVVISGLMKEFDDDFDDITKFLSLIGTRSLQLRNVFFEINWDVFLTVSLNFEPITLIK